VSRRLYALADEIEQRAREPNIVRLRK
jgi:hypothetical protein